MKRILFLATIPLFLLLVSACNKSEAVIEPIGPKATILAYGDSLTYGSGATRGESYPAILQGLLKRSVVNAGNPGETSERGLKRLPYLLKQQQPDLLILCHGGNDFLQRRNQEQLAENLRQMVKIAKEAGSDVILVGVPNLSMVAAPPSFYEKVAEEFNIPYEGDILRRLLTDKNLKSDAIHPNAEGYRQMAEALHALIEKSQRK